MRTQNIADYLLNQCIQDDFQFDGNFVHPLTINGFLKTIGANDEAIDLGADSAKLLDYCDLLHSWIPANPNKKDVVEHLNELYVVYHNLQEEEKKNEHIFNYDANDGEGIFTNFYNYIVRHDAFLFIGNKGAGKTTFINYWFNNYTSVLDREKIIWFRIDASKIYRSWTLENYNTYNLSDYHRVHAVYVTLSYASVNNVFGDILNCLLKKSNDDDELKAALTKVRSYISLVRSRIKEYDNYRYAEITDTFIKKIFSNDKKVAQCKIVFNQIDLYFAENKYKQFIIIDGIDNIPWHEKNTTYKYKYICKNTAELVTRMNRLEFISDYILMASIRPETERDISYEIENATPETTACGYFEKGYIESPSIEEILTRKALCAQSPTSTRIKTQMNHFLTGVAAKNEYFKYYSQFSENYPTKITNVIYKKYLIAESLLEKKGAKKLSLSAERFREPDSLLKICFNGNIRACCQNFSKVNRIKVFSEKKKIPNAGKEERFPEYLLLNGHRFLNTPFYGRRIKGQAFFNPFWWDNNLTSHDPYKWYGLVSLRILQLLLRRTIHSDKLVEIICTLFKYNSKDVVDNALNKLVSKGFITIDRNQDPHKNEFYYKISDKGRFLLDFMFIYPDWLYFCALDTPLDSLCIENSKKFKIHRNKDMKFLDNYYMAFITTTKTFLQHMYLQQKKDMLILRDSYLSYSTEKGNEFKLFKDFQTVLNIFQLPDILPISMKNYYRKALRSLSKTYPMEKFNEFIAECSGLELKYFDEMALGEIGFSYKNFRCIDEIT